MYARALSNKFYRFWVTLNNTLSNVLVNGKLSTSALFLNLSTMPLCQISGHGGPKTSRKMDQRHKQWRTGRLFASTCGGVAARNLRRLAACPLLVRPIVKIAQSRPSPLLAAQSQSPGHNATSMRVSYLFVTNTNSLSFARITIRKR